MCNLNTSQNVNVFSVKLAFENVCTHCKQNETYSVNVRIQSHTA